MPVKRMAHPIAVGVRHVAFSFVIAASIAEVKRRRKVLASLGYTHCVHVRWSFRQGRSRGPACRTEGTKVGGAHLYDSQRALPAPGRGGGAQRAPQPCPAASAPLMTLKTAHKNKTDFSDGTT